MSIGKEKSEGKVTDPITLTLSAIEQRLDELLPNPSEREKVSLAMREGH